MFYLLKTLILSFSLLFILKELYMNLEKQGQDQSFNYQKKLAVLHEWANETADQKIQQYLPTKNLEYDFHIDQEPQYCLKADTYKLIHPDVIYKDQMVFREINDFVRFYLQTRHIDALPNYRQYDIYLQLQNENLTLDNFIIPLQTTLLFPFSIYLFQQFKINYEQGCLFNKHYHLPGEWQLSQKSFMSNNLARYLAKMADQNKSQQCLDDAQVTKKTFRLWNKKECSDFFSIINGSEYQKFVIDEGLKYIFKTNTHLGKGILLVDSTNEAKVREWYDNGNQCGENRTYSIVQEYVREPFLYHGHKLEFRVYFSIPSTNPPIVYVHKRALLKKCALKYDLKNFTMQGHVCNTAVTKDLETENEGEKEEELYIDWNLEELQQLLIDEGKINSTNWLDEYLYPQMMRKVTHLYLSVHDKLLQDSRMGEYFGLDFILDNDLKLWILECNGNFNYFIVTEERQRKFHKLVDDMIELQFSLLKGRYKRLKKFIDEEMHDLHIRDHKDYLRERFHQLFKDKIDKDFQLSTGNLNMLAFYMDNENGIYESYISEECRINM